MANPVAATYRGKPHPNSDLWRGVRAKPGFSFVDTAYEVDDPDLTGGLTTMCFGMVVMRQKHVITLAELGETYWDCVNAGTQGHNYTADNAPPGTGFEQGRVGDGGGPVVPNRLDPLDPDDTGYASPHHHNRAGFIEHVCIGYEAAGDYAESGFLNFNGRDHLVGTGAGFTEWRTGGVSTTPIPLRIGATQGGPPQLPFLGIIVGWWMHTEYLTEDERFGLRQEIELARGIPEIPKISGVALDHIWSLKDAALGTPPSTLVSKGAIGGKSFPLVGTASNLEVVDFQGDFGPR